MLPTLSRYSMYHYRCSLWVDHFHHERYLAGLVRLLGPLGRTRAAESVGYALAIPSSPLLILVALITRGMMEPVGSAPGL